MTICMYNIYLPEEVIIPGIHYFITFCTFDYVGNQSCNPFGILIIHPRIDWLSPNSGSTGDIITINGWGFAWFNKYDQSNDYISLDNFKVGSENIVEITPTTLSFIIPQEITCSGSVKKSVNVTVNGVSSSAHRDLMVYAPSPAVNIVSPLQDSQVCPDINVTGTFTDNSGCGIDYIKVNGVNAQIRGNTYSANITASTTGPMTITVEIKDKAGGVATVTRNVNVVSPSITSISPLYGPPGTVVTINGNCFSTDKSEDKIIIAGYQGAGQYYRLVSNTLTGGDIISVSANQIQISIPGNSPGGDNSIYVKVNNFASNTETFFVDPLLSIIYEPCPGKFYSTGGAGYHFGSKVQIYDSLSGAWYDYEPPQYNNAQIFVDNYGNMPPLDPCTDVVGNYGNIPTLAAPTIYFSSCFPNPPVTLKLRVNNHLTRPDGSPSISGEYYLIVKYACGF